MELMLGILGSICASTLRLRCGKVFKLSRVNMAPVFRPAVHTSSLYLSIRA